MARSGPVLVSAAVMLAAACSYKFDVPDNAQIACSDGGSPCPDGWDCDTSVGRCVVHGSVPEIPEIRVSPGTPLATTEGAPPAALAVTLGATPTDVVQLLVYSTVPTEALAAPGQLTFTSANWNQPQTVTVQGIRDFLVDGNKPYELVLGPPISNDARFSSLPAVRIPGTNADADTARIMVPPTVATSESDTQDTPIQVTLSTQPSNLVVIPVDSSDTSEATVTPATIAFDAGTWSTPQIIRVLGVDDAPTPTADGKRPYTIRLGPATSADPLYAGVTANIAGTNDDNDSPGVHVSPSTNVVLYESGFGSYGYLYVDLFTQPTSDVTITFTSLNPTEVTVDPAYLVFDAGTWNYQQGITLQAVDDPYDEPASEHAPWTIQTGNAVSADPNYSGYDVTDVTGETWDEDYAYVLFDGSGGGYFYSVENDSAKQVLVTLQSKPHGDVTIQAVNGVSSRFSVAPTTLTLTPSNWQTGVTMTITPLDNNVRDGDANGNITFSIAASAQDPSYQMLMLNPYYLSVEDDERIIFSLTAAMTGDLTGGAGYVQVDYWCQQEGSSGGQTFSSSYALLASDDPTYSFRRIATINAGTNDGQYNWVLYQGRNYVLGTRNGPVIGRANALNLLSFPLAHALASADYWTGMTDNWYAAESCNYWTDGTLNSTGWTGSAASTTSSAISSSVPTCDSPRRILCVEQ